MEVVNFLMWGPPGMQSDLGATPLFYTLVIGTSLWSIAGFTEFLRVMGYTPSSNDELTERMEKESAARMILLMANNAGFIDQLPHMDPGILHLKHQIANNSEVIDSRDI